MISTPRMPRRVALVVLLLAATACARARSGVTTTRGMIPSFPTVTFPNFYALATGLYPDHSGIVNNRFFDPAYDSEFVNKDPIAHESHRWGGEPIWVTAKKQGARS